MSFVNKIKGWGQRGEGHGDVIEEVRPSVDPYAAADDLAAQPARESREALPGGHGVEPVAPFDAMPSEPPRPAENDGSIIFASTPSELAEFSETRLQDPEPAAEPEPEPEADVPSYLPTRLADSSFEDDAHVLDGLEASPTLVLPRTRTASPRLVLPRRVKTPEKREVSMTETELSASPTSARSLKLRPEHERFLGMGFESEVDG